MCVCVCAALSIMFSSAKKHHTCALRLWLCSIVMINNNTNKKHIDYFHIRITNVLTNFSRLH